MNFKQFQLFLAICFASYVIFFLSATWLTHCANQIMERNQEPMGEVKGFKVYTSTDRQNKNPMGFDWDEWQYRKAD